MSLFFDTEYFCVLFPGLPFRVSLGTEKQAHSTLLQPGGPEMFGKPEPAEVEEMV